MNMQNIMRQAQKMQKELVKAQEELDKKTYEGSSSLVKIVINGKKEVVSVKIDDTAEITSGDVEILEDMIMVAFNDAIKKADKDRDSKFSKYGNLSGLM